MSSESSPLKGFEYVIDGIEAIKIFDGGGGGLEGENTTNYLIKKYGLKNITCLSKDLKMSDVYRAQHPGVKIINKMFEWSDCEGFDLVIHDFNIETNMELWENPPKLSVPLVTYVMTDINYHPKLREHALKVWGTDNITEELVAKRVKKVSREVRRPEILWVLL